MKKLIILLAFCIILLTACAQPTAAPTAIPTNVPTATILPTSTLEPTPSATVASATPAPTVTPSATPIPLKITYMGSSTNSFQGSTTFTLQFNQAVGSYNATGSVTGRYVNYICKFDSVRTTNLVCTGGLMPGNTQVYIQLFDATTNATVYSNMITFPDVSTPAGMDCVSEPQWGGKIPAHQREQGCFAITCFLNGEFFYGNNYICLGEWPYLWPFPHPLYDILMNQK